MKPKVAFFDFTSCEGCQLTVVDSLQTHVDLLDAVEIVQFREAMSEKSDDYAIAFVEGSISRESDEARLKQIRERAAVLVALGACAHLGGINAIRNAQPLDDVRKYVYGDKADWYETYPARPLSAVVKVDAFIPGCPIDREEFIEVVKAVLLGKKLPIPDYPMCVECKRKENVCLFHKGGFCLGPVTRAGCGAICPTNGDGCEGCRGLIPNPNINSESDVLVKYGLTVDDMLAKWTMFGTYQQMEMKAQK
jgi:sulfhydrogenase subunit delta